MKTVLLSRAKGNIKTFETKLQERRGDKKKKKRSEREEHQSNAARNDKANASEQ